MVSMRNLQDQAVEVDGLTYRYGERLALENLNFSVGAGEIYGLLGPNGGGKTTLFQLLSSLRYLQSGSVRIFGMDLATPIDSGAAIDRRRLSVAEP